MTARPIPAYKRMLPGGVALAIALSLFWVAQIPTTSASGQEKSDTAGGLSFRQLPIAMPPGYRPTKTVREVNPQYHHLRSWISSVGAAVSLNDLWGRGRADGLCLVDPRTDQVVLSYAPTAPTVDRFTPFVLDPAPLPMDEAMAPMGCTAGDFNLDGRTDLVVNYWGRTPIMFLARSTANTLTPATYEPTELVAQVSVDGRYHGPRWNTNALLVGDLEGNGNPDIYVANYFPDSDVLDPHGPPNVTMNSSMSNAKNGGGTHVLRWYAATSGAHPSVSYVEEKYAVPYDASTGWTLAISGADLTGDGKTDLYIANDFGKDHLLHNVSTPGRIRFVEATTGQSPTITKSFNVGHDSFKGMGVDFADLNNKGRFDILVSNITAAWGLEESNLIFLNDTTSDAEMRSKLGDGQAPFTQQAQKLGLAWTGWGWDIKAADFRNDGNLDVLQAAGFIQGTINRWPWLQEMAMSNDSIYPNPKMWPKIEPGDDIDGHTPMAFYSRSATGKAYVNVSDPLGITDQTPTRAIAIGDVLGDGRLDFAVARQWGPPAFFSNTSPAVGNALELTLYRPATDTSGDAGLQALGTPAYGTRVRIVTADGRTQMSQLDGGGGHAGRRSFQVHFGLGASNAPVLVHLTWNDSGGQLHEQSISLLPGTHSLLLDRDIKEADSR